MCLLPDSSSKCITTSLLLLILLLVLLLCFFLPSFFFLSPCLCLVLLSHSLSTCLWFSGSALAASVCKKITGRLTSAIAKQEDVSVQLEALDIMADMLCRYSTHDQVQVLTFEYLMSYATTNQPVCVCLSQ